jgi:dihydroorotase
MLLFRKPFIVEGNEWHVRDVLIERGVFRKIGRPGELNIRGTAEIIKSDGKYLIPGFIDPHVHVREPGDSYKEDWDSCSRAALKGGSVAIFDMPNNREPVVDERTLLIKRKIALQKSYVNFGLYIALTDKNTEAIASTNVQRIICGVKIYLSRTTGDITVRSENSIIRVFGQQKPVLVHTGGADGLSRILFFYKKASARSAHVPVLYICHTSTGEEISMLRTWKKKYPSIHVEVCPHHLFLNEESYTGLPGVLPPLSSKSDNEALWQGIEDGTVDLIGSDHAPHTVDEKMSENPPSGFPGLETALPLVLDAVEKRGISLDTMLRLTSGSAKRLFHLGEHAGIREGEQAHCTLLEKGNFTFGEEEYVTKCNWSPFNGWKHAYRPVFIVVNGCIAYDGERMYRQSTRMLTC